MKNGHTEDRAGQAPSTQRTDSDLMATKINGYTESRARQSTSSSTKRTDCDLRAMKTYDNAKSHVGHKEDSQEGTDNSTEGCNEEGTSARSGQTLV